MKNRGPNHIGIVEILLVFSIGFLACFFLLFYSTPPCHKVNNISTLSDAQLQKWYEGANEDYFLNQLPKNVTVRWANLAPLSDMGLTAHRPDGSILILIDRNTNPTNRQAELTAYHESCHVKTYMQEFDDHGPKFEACMVHLADQGAFKGLW